MEEKNTSKKSTEKCNGTKSMGHTPSFGRMVAVPAAGVCKGATTQESFGEKWGGSTSGRKNRKDYGGGKQSQKDI